MSAAKLLLVEDDPALSELLEFRFQKEGYDVRVTPDGDDALLFAAEELPDLIILDWMIEGTSGIEVCRRLRRDKNTAHVPIIMLTAREAEDDRIRGLETRISPAQILHGKSRPRIQPCPAARWRVGYGERYRIAYGGRAHPPPAQSD